jgi:hypothetical protein
MSTLTWKNYTFQIEKGKLEISPKNATLLGRAQKIMYDLDVPGYSMNVDNDLARGLVKELPGAKITHLGEENDLEGAAFGGKLEFERRSS